MLLGLNDVRITWALLTILSFMIKLKQSSCITLFL
ncbi:mCG1041712 [Mus musculus]|nr:mCG1041712 [Mus musculus]